MTNEQRLWVSVLNQAVRDAFIQEVESKTERLARDQARSWLVGGSADFREVCLMAGVEDSGVINKWARKCAAGGWPRDVMDRAKEIASAGA